MLPSSYLPCSRFLNLKLEQACKHLKNFANYEKFPAEQTLRRVNRENEGKTNSGEMIFQIQVHKFLFTIKYLPALTSLSVISCLLILPSCIRSFSGTVYLLLQNTDCLYSVCKQLCPIFTPALRSSSVN